jgi:hypothetical protein
MIDFSGVECLNVCAMNQRTKETSKPRSESFGVKTPNARATRLRQPKKHKPTTAGMLVICRKMQRKQRNPFYLLSTFFFLFFDPAKNNQHRKVNELSNINQIANSRFDTLYPAIISLFPPLFCWSQTCNNQKSTKTIYLRTTMSDNDAKMAAVDSSSPMSDINPQSSITSPPPSNNLHQTHNHTSTDNINHQNTTTSPTPPPHQLTSLSHNKRSRGRPRKYHTDAEREEAKRRYRENHKTKAASSSGGVAVSGASGAANAGALTAVAAGVATTFAPGYEGAKQRDVDELWGVVRVLQEEVRGLREELAQRDGDAVAASAGQKRKKVWNVFVMFSRDLLTTNSARKQGVSLGYCSWVFTERFDADVGRW